MINICCMSANALMLACNWVMYLNTQSDISVVLRESHSSHMYTANIPVDFVLYLYNITELLYGLTNF